LTSENPDLRILDRQLALAEAQQALAATSYLPDLLLGADWIDTGRRPLPDLPENGKDPIIARIGFSLPLWFGKQRAAAREAAAEAAAARARRQARADALALELEEVLFALRDAERKIALFGRTLIPKAREGLAVTRQAFMGGTARYAELIDAQQALLELQLGYAHAQATRGERAATLAALLGEHHAPEGESP
jgi:outer membrane protein TolC